MNDIKPICLAHSPGDKFICTLTKGHDGLHIAEGISTAVVKAWTDEPTTAGQQFKPAHPPVASRGTLNN